MNTKNPYAKENVNVAQGPRVGNSSPRAGKRGVFLDSKAERQPLADEIERAFAARDRELEANPGEHEVPESGGIDSDSQVRRFAARKSRYRD